MFADLKEKLKEQLELNKDIWGPFQSFINSCKQASVLVALFELDGKVYIILTKRSEHLSLHKGDVCLPGGKKDESDVDLTETALRETEEEIGLERKHLTILGKTVCFFSIVGIAITPIIAIVKDITAVQFKINHSEVDTVFACPLDFFFHTENHYWDKMHFYHFSCPIQSSKTMYQNPALKQLFINPMGQTFKIWGVTAHIILPFACLLYGKSVKLGDFCYDVSNPYKTQKGFMATKFPNLMKKNSKL